jgi:diguanylate cyclase (GGDEF)-like protein
LDRSPTATIARTGGRLAAALLPLAALGLFRFLQVPSGVTAAWAPHAAAGVAATLAGLALLVAVAASLEDGGVREIADAAALGILGTTFTVVAMDGADTVGLGIGVMAASAAFLIGSLAGGLAIAGRGRGAGIVAAVVLVEAVLGAILLSPRLGIDESSGPVLVASGALVLAFAALASLRTATRATALGILASSAVVLALAGSAGGERLIGPAGVAIGVVVLGGGAAIGRLRNVAPIQPAAGDEPSPERAPYDSHEPEFDELRRIGRELRATLDDLVAARRLIDLQRAEIERVSNTDPLTELASRGPTLERLRTEASEARRYAHPLAVVLVDVDRFAALNHGYGLEVGDRILRDIALRLRVRCREADAVGRIGADSFLAILPHTDEGGAATFARAVLNQVLVRQVMTDRGELTVSLSIGIALMRLGMTLSGDELLAAAEEALASARAAGGNRIAYDRLHGLARLDERARHPQDPTQDTTGDTAAR